MESVKFSEDYFEGEYREGFFVESMMKRAWAAQIEVLKEIDTVCSRHDISWFADWGTLLGAARHHGFIPWDDDIDIVMKRADLEKFVAVAGKELPSGYGVLNVNTEDEWDQVHTRVVNRRKVTFDENELKKFHGCPYAVGVDIFILDYVPRDSEAKSVQCELIHALLMLVTLCNEGEADMEEHIQQIEQLCGVKLDRNANLVNQVLRLVDKLCQLYGEAESDNMAEMPYYTEKQEIQMRKEWYDETIFLPFETIMIPVPKYYDEALRAMYGDWHKFVRVMEGAHDYPFYKAQQAYIDEILEKSKIANANEWKP